MKALRDRTAIQVGLVQIGDKFGEEYYLPYSIGLLQAYARKNLRTPDQYHFMVPVFSRIDPETAVRQLAGAQIIFFSTYLWNFNLSLAIAKGVKKTNKNCVVVFGGPQIPESASGLELFLRKYPFLDIACYGEGEVTFLKILENLPERSWDQVSSIGFVVGDGRFIYTPVRERLSDINEIPSPYVEGVFDPLLTMDPEQRWSALLETNRGCPYNCTYCYWGKKARNRLNQVDAERVFGEIDWISRHKIEFVFCCDSNFGLLPRDEDIARKVAANKKEYGYPKAFSIQNTKNSSAKILKLQKILNDAGLQKGVNLALQSLNQATLKSICRTNITNTVYRELQRTFTQSGIQTFSDIIIGLPDETYDSFTNGVSSLIESGQHNRIQFINLAILENTEMSEPHYQERFGMLIKESKLIAHHSSIDNQSGVYETQRLVVGTRTMPVEEFKKTKVFCWMLSLLYFNKLLQIPLALLNKLAGMPFRDMFELFSEDKNSRGIIPDIAGFFFKKAADIQQGEGDFIGSKEWLNIWWPADEYIFIKLCREGFLDAFYGEAEEKLRKYLELGRIEFSADALHDAIMLNAALIKRPFVQNDLPIFLRFNILDVYRGILNGEDIPLKADDFHHIVNRERERWTSWDSWMKEVVWYGTKKGAYLYDCK